MLGSPPARGLTQLNLHHKTLLNMFLKHFYQCIYYRANYKSVITVSSQLYFCLSQIKNKACWFLLLQNLIPHFSLRVILNDISQLTGIFKMCYCTYKIFLGRILILQSVSPKCVKEYRGRARTQDFRLLRRTEKNGVFHRIVGLINTTLSRTLQFL